LILSHAIHDDKRHLGAVALAQRGQVPRYVMNDYGRTWGKTVQASKMVLEPRCESGVRLTSHVQQSVRFGGFPRRVDLSA
jgi:hypothetical protein